MTNKSAFITGGSKRIGKQIALSLAKKGYDIAISYNNSKEEAQNLKNQIEKEYQAKCEIYQCDISKKANCISLINQVLQDFPNLSLLINNASIFNKSNFTQENDEYSNNMAIHVEAPIILAKEFVKNIENRNIKNANIINITDKSVTRHSTQYFYYLLSKKALDDLTKMLAIDLAPNIRVNAIAPGYILDDKFMNAKKELARIITDKIPLKRKGDTDNITSTVSFIVENNYVTGQTLFIDGGSSLNNN